MASRTLWGASLEIPGDPGTPGVVVDLELRNWPPAGARVGGEMTRERVEKIIGSKEAAIELGISQNALRKLCRRGKIAGADLVKIPGDHRDQGEWLIPSPVMRLNGDRS